MFPFKAQRSEQPGVDKTSPGIGRRKRIITQRRKKTRGIIKGYRSGLEDAVADQLKALDIKVEYEKLRLPYKVREDRHYKPDFQLPNGIIIETKGRFTLDDRKKHLYVKEQHPDLDIRFVFSNSKAKLTKGSKTTYGEWCTKHGFKFADKLIPEEWINE